MAIIHMILQGKGGVGKSFIASLLFQYLKEKDMPVKGFDTDPINNTFAGYKEFDVQPLELMRGDDIDKRRFDQLVEGCCECGEDTHVVVDSGASSFVPLCGYLKEHNALRLLAEKGQEIYIHTVVTGGLAMPDTLKGLYSLATHFPDVPLAVWLNPYFGDIVLGGNDFFNFKVYEELSEAFKAVIQLPRVKAGTFSEDLEEFLPRRMSFAAAHKSNIHLMTRQRLVMIWRDFKEAIERSFLI